MSSINVKDLTFVYDGSFNNIFENVSFNIDTDWKLGLIGRNGKGKTTFLKLLQGKYEYKGTISKNIEVDYFPFEVKDKEKMAIEIVNEIAPKAEDWEIIKEINLIGSDTEILQGNLETFARESNVEESIFKAMLAKMGFSQIDFDTDIKNMSEGQKKKVLIAKSISESANIYVWDEPLNYIDILTREQIEEAILKYMPTLILVEHDKMFIDKVATKIIKLEK